MQIKIASIPFILGILWVVIIYIASAKANYHYYGSASSSRQTKNVVRSPSPSQSSTNSKVNGKPKYIRKSRFNHLYNGKASVKAAQVKDPVRDTLKLEKEKNSKANILAKRQIDYSARVQRLAEGPGKNSGGMEPVRGPYSKFSAVDGYEGPSGNGAAAKQSFKSWNEYTETRKSSIISGASRAGNRKAASYVPVMNPDEHFRYMDKLYQAKNERVKTFHDLYMFIKKQGKPFQFSLANSNDQMIV